MANVIPHYAGMRQLSLGGWRRVVVGAGLLLAVVGVPAAAADGIYRWVDELGRVHFGARPGADNAQRLDIDTAPPATKPDPVVSRRQENQRRLLDDFTRERELRQAEEAERAARERERAALCAELEAYREQLIQQGPLYDLRPDGGREYLDDERRAAELQQVNREMRTTCAGR